MNLNELAKKYITGDVLQALPKREFGKYMSDPAEMIVKEEIEKEFNIKVYKDGDDSNSAGHYDLYTDSNFRIQVKFRSVNGTTPTSRQIYLHNWRQKLNYNISDFDCIIFVLCHNEKRQPSDWKFCFVPSEKVIDSKDKSLMLKDIPPHILKQGLDWKKEFYKYFKKNEKKS